MKHRTTIAVGGGSNFLSPRNCTLPASHFEIAGATRISQQLSAPNQVPRGGALESRPDRSEDFIRRGGRPWDRAAPRGAPADNWREWPRRLKQSRRAKSSAGRKA